MLPLMDFIVASARASSYLSKRFRKCDKQTFSGAKGISGDDDESLLRTKIFVKEKDQARIISI